jgi:uncharacterized protein with PIN domain
MESVVFDAQPLVALLTGEPRAKAVRDRIAGYRGSLRVVISSVNWCEVLYVLRRHRDQHAAAAASALLGRIPLEVVDATEELATTAAEFKARFGLGLGDSFAAALAATLGAPLLTGDADFLPLAEHGLRVEWAG